MHSNCSTSMSIYGCGISIIELHSETTVQITDLNSNTIRSS